jgi:hypothetical protein
MCERCPPLLLSDLMAKEKTPDDVSSGIDSFFSSELNAARVVRGERAVFEGDTYSRRIYGLELPYLNIQYLFATSVMLMEKIYLIAGTKASHKSCLAFEFARWCALQNGFARLYETEDKYNPQLVRDMWGNVLNNNTWRVTDCNTVTDWQEALNADLNSYRNAFRIGMPLNRGEQRLPLLPCAYIVDSLTGRGTSDQKDKIEQKGEVELPGFAQAKTASQISYFFQNLDVMDIPCYVFIIRHEKEAMEQSGPGGMMSVKKMRTPGGSDPDFRGGFDLRCKLIGSKRLTRYQCNDVRITMTKCGFGPDRRRIVVPFGWEFFVTNDGETLTQAPRWEWAWAECEFLKTFGADAKEPKGIRDICALDSKSDPNAPGNLYTCKQLGLKDVNARDMSLAIHQDATMTRDLQNFLEIQRLNPFSPQRELVAPTRKAKKKK